MNSNWVLRLVILAIVVTVAIGLWSRKTNVAEPDASRQEAGNANLEANRRSTVQRRARPWETFPNRQRTFTPPTFPPKAPPEPLFVEWRGHWYPAEILSSWGNSNLIRYIGYGPEWDEWITEKRMRYGSEGASPEGVVAPAVITWPVIVKAETIDVPPQPVVQGSPAKGELLVHWGNQWWPAEIVKSEGGSHFIHYKGYGTNWDEWVTAERMGVYEGD